MWSNALRTGLRVSLGGTAAFATCAGYTYVYAKDKQCFVIYAGPGMEELAVKMVRAEPGRHRNLPIKWETRGDGSTMVRVEGLKGTAVTNADVLFLASFHDSNALVAQYNAMYKLCEAPINSMTVVAPYLPGTVDNCPAPTARLLSNLPATARPHRIISYDTAMNSLGSVKANVLSTAPLVTDLIESKKFTAVVLPSENAKDTFAEAAKDVAVVGVTNGSVASGSAYGKHVLIVDTVLNQAAPHVALAKTLKSEGALSVSLYCTHGVPHADWDKLVDSNLHKVYVTNSFRGAKAALPKAVNSEVLDLGPIIMKTL
eukprot:Rhum_TRINITY_DN3618_c0_g1::Rhum_TRINITY_DN3618_c0_g1_i1::g.11526::m.11526